jgi:uncharacterized protein DUF3857/transglutaminase superfamily protein
VRRLAVCAALLAAAAWADEAPSWLREAATAKLPEYGKKTPAAVLLNEERVTVDESGKVVTAARYAVRILNREGRSHAVARRIYHTGGKVKELEAWIVYPSGEVKKFGKGDTADVGLVTEDMYNEVRARVILGSGRADPGAVFGFEAVTEEKTVFTQFEWHFQDTLPARTSRFELKLPEGWRAEAIMFNHPVVTPQVTGSSYSWQLQNLPPIEPEEAGPKITSIAPRLAVSFFPPKGSRTDGRTFASWTDVSTWLSELNDPQAVPDERLASKAKELAGPAAGEWERIEAIGRYVQAVRYVSIQTGLNRGGGYKPHAASEIFAKAYGDCKDKANLMRAMLKAAGIDAFPVAIYSGDRTYVRPDWPSPHQFNHAIVAVKVSPAIQASAVVKHPQLGALLLFDPTDEHTPVGWLPAHEQGSHALIVAGEGGALLRLPLLGPDRNRVEHTTEVSLSADGGIAVRLRERNVGEPGIQNRRLYRTRTPAEYTKVIERWVGHDVTAASVAKVDAKEPAPAEFVLEVNFSAPKYSQIMQGRLLIFRPSILAPRDRPALSETQRKYPLVIEAEAYVETMRVEIPAGFTVDEIPAPVKLATAFGKWDASCEYKDGKLVLTRKLELQPVTLPPDQQRQVREFFGQVAGSEQAPVVLLRR